MVRIFIAVGRVFAGAFIPADVFAKLEKAKKISHTSAG